MRIALVCPYSLAVPGGVQQQVVGLARALGDSGEDVTVLAPTGGGPVRSADVRGYGLVLVGHSLSLPANGSRAPVAITPSAWRLTSRTLRELGPEVVHVHEPLAPVVSLASLSAHVAPTLGTFHRAGVSRGYRLAGRLARPLTHRLDGCTAVSEAARATATEVLGADPGCEVLWNGVDVERFAGAEPWPVSTPTVLFAGRHEPRKGLAILLDAFASVPGDVRLSVVGAGPLTAALRRSSSADQRIEWCGAVSDEELASRLAAATLFVAPSLGGESFGVVLLEAMAAGTAVVASDLTGYRLAGGDAARFVPPGDRAGLASAIGELLADPETRDALVRRGRELASARSFRQLASAYRVRYGDLPGAGSASAR